MLATALIGSGALGVLLLLGCQRKLIYHPSPYRPDALAAVAGRVERIPYRIAAGPQVAFYRPPARSPATAPGRLWVVLAGNASLSLEFLDLIDHAAAPRAGYLMIDYPGYGLNAGRPSRAAINESLPAALEAIGARLGAQPGTAELPLGILGHSLGAAAALELAVRSRPDRIVLIAPFTTLRAMARQVVGWPLCEMLHDRFDNEDRLAELAARTPRPALTIVHGSADGVVPATMGRALADAYPGWIRYREIAGGDHNRILSDAEAVILHAMDEPSDGPAAPAME